MTSFFSLSNPFFGFALGWAIFFGWRAVPIFVKSEIYAKKKWDWWLYQVWFNALGAFVGWVALWSVWNLHHLTFEYTVLVLVAFLGITGNLPYVVMLGKIKPE